MFHISIHRKTFCVYFCNKLFLLQPLSKIHNFIVYDYLIFYYFFIIKKLNKFGLIRLFSNFII